MPPCIVSATNTMMDSLRRLGCRSLAIRLTLFGVSGGAPFAARPFDSSPQARRPT